MKLSKRRRIRAPLPDRPGPRLGRRDGTSCTPPPTWRPGRRRFRKVSMRQIFPRSARGGVGRKRTRQTRRLPAGAPGVRNRHRRRRAADRRAALPDPLRERDGLPTLQLPDEASCGLRLLMQNVRGAISGILDKFTLAEVIATTVFHLRGLGARAVAPARSRHEEFLLRRRSI